MKVILKEKEYEYLSDYPEGWLFSSGDYFKFPVAIGNYKCFVKRFQKKTPHDISGWGLLNDLKAKYEPNLPRIHDIVKTEEKGREIYYVFYELLDGNTLNKLIPEKDDLNLQELTENLFTAIHSLSEHDYWFADFCEKNIFCTRFNHYFLVDLDSTYPVTAAPNNDMYGSKDYWILVMNFYKQFVNVSKVKASDFNGVTFNYLQIIFLILKLKLFYANDQSDYNDTEVFNRLPAILNDIDPEFKEIFEQVYENKTENIPADIIEKIKKLVLDKIVNGNEQEIKMDRGYHGEQIADPEPEDAPVILEFATSANKVKKGELFTLSWEIKNYNKSDLYKNGAFYKNLHREQKKISLTEFIDGSKKDIIYELIAFKDGNQTKSEPVIIALKNTSVVKYWPAAAIAAAVIIVIVLFFILPPKPKQDLAEKGHDTIVSPQPVPIDTSKKDTLIHPLDSVDANGSKLNRDSIILATIKSNHDNFQRHHDDFSLLYKDFLRVHKRFLGVYDDFMQHPDNDTKYQRLSDYFKAIDYRYIEIKKDGYQKLNDDRLSLNNDIQNFQNNSIEKPKIFIKLQNDSTTLQDDFKKLQDVSSKYREDSTKNIKAFQKKLQSDSLKRADEILKAKIFKSIVITPGEYYRNGLLKLGKLNRRWFLEYPSSYLLDSVEVKMDYTNCEGKSKKIETLIFKNRKESKNNRNSFEESLVVVKYTSNCTPKPIIKTIYLKNKVFQYN